MNLIRFLIPLTFVSLLSAIPEKAVNKTVKKAWRSLKAERANTTVVEFITLKKIKKDIENNNFAYKKPETIKSEQLDIDCRFAYLEITAQKNENN
ncbi:MAG: hypothetical protein JO129_01445 [Candidatus Dependentiae bacterium]|nr:hypothetical protein [Candidatus Dependentiae bacterium]